MSDSPEARVVIVPYDPTWPSQFVEERALFVETIDRWIAGGIEHIGSTAIPGTPAKPVIDIMVGVESLDASRPALPKLAEIGYMYFPYRPDVMHWFCKPSPAFRTHHLHLVPIGSRLWIERLAFRDYLRANPSKVSEYAELKRRLAIQYEWDREAYTDAKGPFIESILKLALDTAADPIDEF
jgi:GrpB-like predicted nucleotidyltransferase (UPF0157 family)